MPYTVKDYFREFALEHLDTLTLEERLKGIAPEELIEGLSVEERLQSVSLEVALKYFFPEHAEELIKIYYSRKTQKEERKNEKRVTLYNAMKS
ncbi:MAG: hypothetical protein D3916_08220 [Candidatus Electrothrix sp. MAN1_4]|nr:hypothetical protein [Candidatus Electrothrix sp. MAN1_4]